MILSIPERLSRQEEQEWIEKMGRRLTERQAAAARRQQESLEALARQMNERYLDGEAAFTSIAWSDSQKRIFGSCTSKKKTLRISQELQHMPKWVLAYVVLHELAHLIHPDHSRKFWLLVMRYPLADKARGFLLGWATHRRYGNR